jgi:CHAT domain-containing protein/TPR repeat protein
MQVRKLFHSVLIGAATVSLLTPYLARAETFYSPARAESPYPSDERSFYDDFRTGVAEPPGTQPPPPSGGSVKAPPRIACTRLEQALVDPTLSTEDKRLAQEAVEQFRSGIYIEPVQKLLSTVSPTRPVTNYVLGCLMDGLANAELVAPNGSTLANQPAYDAIVKAVELTRSASRGDILKAWERLEIAAQAGFEPARWELAERARIGSSAYHPDNAVAWYRVLAKKHPAAQVILGTFYRDGYHTPFDPAEAVRLFRGAADHGDRDGIFLMADASWRGLTGAGRDAAGMRKWVRKLAEQGDDEGQLIYGVALRDGIGGTSDVRLAQRMFRAAAEQRLPAAQVALANLLRQVPGQSAEADRLIADAARPIGIEPGNCMAALEWLEGEMAGDRLKGLSDAKRSEFHRWLQRCWDLSPFDLNKPTDLMSAKSPGFGVDWHEFANRSRVVAKVLSSTASTFGARYRSDPHDFPPFPSLLETVNALKSTDLKERARTASTLNSLGLGKAAISVLLEYRASEGSGADDLRSEIKRLLEVCDWGPFYSEWVARDWRAGGGHSCRGPDLLTTATIEQLRELDALGVPGAKLFLGIRLLTDERLKSSAEGLLLLRGPISTQSSKEAEIYGSYSLDAEETTKSALAGVWLEEGRGIDPDVGSAARDFRKAIEVIGSYKRLVPGKIPLAHMYWRLGRLLFEGDAREETEGESQRLITAAAHSGLAAAQTSLGDLLLLDGARDEALRWYHLAAAAGDPAAQIRFGFLASIGVWNEDGLGSERWYSLAPVREDPMAAIDLARAIAFAPQRRRSLELVTSNLSIAAGQGNRWASRWLHACERAATVECYRTQPGFSRRIFQELSTKTAKPASLTFNAGEAGRTLAQRRRALVGRLEITREAEDAERTKTILADLEALNVQHGQTDAAIRARLEQLVLGDLTTAAQVNRYHPLLESACRWGQASRFAYRLGHPETAIWFAKESVNRLQEARAYIRELPDDVRECFLDVHQDRYRWLADLFIEAGRFGEANSVLEMLKDFERQRYVGKSAERGLSEERLALSPSEEAASKALARALSATESETDFQRFMADLVERVSALKGNNQSETRFLGSRQIVADLSRRSPETAILQMVVLPDQVRWIISTRRGGQEGFSITLEREQLTALVRSQLESIRSHSPNVKDTSGALYEAVFAKIDMRLQELGIEEVLIQADGQLRYVPFAALWDGAAWLGERYSFSSFRRRDDYLEDATARTDRIVGFGSTLPFGQLPALPEVATELSGIVRTKDMQGQGQIPGTILLNGDFNRSSFEAALAGDYPVIHIASHFVLDPVSADRSYLLLGDSSILPVREFERNDKLTFRQGQLITFSACTTAIGDGSEVDSLASLALDAGARSVVASLWRVSDKSTAQLMQDFYAALATPGSTAAGALAQAQRQMASTGHYQHPYYWAPFILMGRRD